MRVRPAWFGIQRCVHVTRGGPPRAPESRDGSVMSVTAEQVLDALRTVQDPDLHRDLVTLGMIEDLSVADGAVAFTLVLTTAACPLKEQIEGEARAAVEALAGIREVRVNTIS